MKKLAMIVLLLCAVAPFSSPVTAAPKNKKKIAGSNPAPATKFLYDDVLCRHLATRPADGTRCPAPFGMN